MCDTNFQLLPMRTAEEQFAIAGVSAVIRGLCIEMGGLWISGKGGDCLMIQDEWDRYYQLRERWQAAPLDLRDAPGVSMLVATAEEEAEMERLTRRPRSHFADGFREIEGLLLSYNHSLSDEERDDIILTLISKLKPLKGAVLRAEEIYAEGDCNERDELIKAEREIETLQIDRDHEAERANEAQSKVNHLVEMIDELRQSLHRANTRILGGDVV